MGYLDYAGLQYLWGKLKEKFAPKSHSHDDRYYTEAEMDGKLNSKVNNNEAGADSLLSKLTTSWTATPTDNTYFIRQDTGGGNSFGRVKFSTLWTYIKSKADGVYQPKGSYAASGHTHDDRYYTEAEVDGKLTEKLHEETITDARDLNTIKTTGVYHLKTTSYTNGPGISNHATIFVDYTVGTPYQIFIPDSVNRAWRRNHVNSNDTWSAWTELKYTDTNTWRGIQNNLTSDSTSDSLSAAQGKALKGLVDGKAPNEHTHQYLSLYGARPANINFTKSTNGTGAMFHFVATSSTTTGKPPDDSSILQLNWDNSGGWDSQLALSTTAKPHVYYRNQQNGTWGNWSTLLDNLNYTDYAAKKEHTHSKSQITDFPASLKNPTALTIQTNGTIAATYDGSAAKTVNVTKGNIGLGNVDNTADKNKSVASAAKLTTARTVSGGSDITLSFNYDGSGNSTANIGFYSCKHNVDNTNNYPFHRFARLDVNKGAWVDKSITFLISQDYSGGGYGICRLVYRSNADSGNASVDAQWLVRRGFSADTIQVAIKTDKTNGAYCDAFYKSSGTYMGVVIRAIASGGRATSGRTWTLVDSNEVGGTTATDKKTSSECWKTIADAGTALHKQAYSASAPAKDEGYVASAGSANTSSSCTGNSASATKLTSSAGSATQPVYFKDGKPVAGTYTLGDASSKTVRTLGAVGNTGWTNKTTDDKYVPTMSFMAYWNGAYSSTSSNLQYCDRGRFGTIVTKGSGDYAAAGHTHNYAGSGSAGGSANSAVKLDSNAGSSVQPVYFSGGKPVAIGYTISSSVPANAKFTDTTYGVASSSSNGLMSSTDKTKLDDFSRVISIQKQIKLTTDWLDTGIAGNSLDTGTYVIQVSGFNSSYTQLYSEIYSGVMSWYSGTTNSGNSSEIFLHNAGLADNNNAIYLRTLRVAGSKTLKLQIACKVAATGTDILTFKFRRLI